MNLGALDRGLVGLNQSGEACDIGYALVEQLLRGVAVLGQRGGAIEILLGVGETGLVLRQLGDRLIEGGLKRRAFYASDQRDETRYLEPLHEIVARGTTPAEELLAKYQGGWSGSVDPVFDELAY